MDLIRFTVPGQPVAKGRARSTIRNGFVAHYTPEKTANYESLVKLAAHRAMERLSPWEFAVELKITAYMQIPASWSQKKQEAARRGEIRPKTKPDLDNIVKAIKDGMNGIVFKDDSQVIEVFARKFYGDPRVFVEAKFTTE